AALPHVGTNTTAYLFMARLTHKAQVHGARKLAEALAGDENAPEWTRVFARQYFKRTCQIGKPINLKFRPGDGPPLDLKKSGVAQSRTGTPLFQEIPGSEQVREQAFLRVIHALDPASRRNSMRRCSSSVIGRILVLTRSGARPAWVNGVNRHNDAVIR